MGDTEYTNHLAALARCREAGFEFCETSQCLCGVRRSSETIDVLLVHDASEARVTRYRRTDLVTGESPEAVWCVTGTVSDVVHGALALTAVGAT